MSRSRRQFLMQASAGLLGAATVGAVAQTTEPPPGTPPAFGTGPLVGPEVSAATFTEAEKLVQITLKENEREIAARSWRSNMAALYERRTGPRKVALEPTLAPALRWDPVLPALKSGPERDRFMRSKNDPGPLPSRDEDIAFAPVTQLSRWIETASSLPSGSQISIWSGSSVSIPKLRCVITLLREPALAQAKQADAEIAAGKYRGPLHGIPWGAKDLLDTAEHPDHLWRRAVPQPRANRRRGRRKTTA